MTVTPTMPWTRVQPLQGVSADLWKTHWGVRESVAVTGVGEWLENSPFRVKSGSYKISTDTINGKSVKVLECVTAGLIYMHSSYFHQTETESAYGDFLWFMNSATGSNTSILPIHNQIANLAVGNNYNLAHLSNGDVFLRRVGANIITGGNFAKNTWYCWCLSRSATGLFELFIDNQSQGTVTDNTYTISKYWNMDLDAGDKIAYSDICGGHAIVKRK